jgi:hypothetical protein
VQISELESVPCFVKVIMFCVVTDLQKGNDICSGPTLVDRLEKTRDFVRFRFGSENR